VFYDKPFVKFERILMTYIATFPRSLPSFAKSMPVWMKEKLWIPRLIGKHSATRARCCSPSTTSRTRRRRSWPRRSRRPRSSRATASASGRRPRRASARQQLRAHTEIRFPHSLGLLYSAFTYYLGFKVNSAEYKVMGAAPYGTPKYADKILESWSTCAKTGRSSST
jgi:carbamoyltransferase